MARFPHRHRKVLFLNATTFLPDERPSDFHARFGRRARPLSARRKGAFALDGQGGQRLAVLAAAIAVPAFAAPTEWQMPAFLSAEPAEAAPMGFETPGESFPGSAFYYLDDDGTTAASATASLGGPLDGEAHWDSEEPAPAIKGVARPLYATGTPTDAARALHCLTQAIYYEAASESDAGQRAVAQVVLNRVAHPAYPKTVCGVVYQGSERRTGCQFTFTCDGALARVPSRFAWDRARGVAQAALAGAVYTPVGLATHYHTIQIHPYWADSLNRVTTIGAHIFYSWRGAAGRSAAFSDSYIGNEPVAAPHPRSVVDPSAGLDPVGLERAFEAGLQRTATVPGSMAAQSPAASPAALARPDYTPAVQALGGEARYAGSRLPDSGGVKEEYAHSGEWIAAPR